MLGTSTEKSIECGPDAEMACHGRILLVEDSLVNQKVATRILQKLGHEVDVAANGLHALDAVQKNEYDLVFMDCQMPEMDGYTATTELRRREQGTSTHLPIVALTANAMTGDREKCLASGMDDYLSKPINQEAIKKVLDYWLSNKAVPSTTNGGANIGAHDRLDLETLTMLYDLEQDQPDLIKELVDYFIADMPSQLEQLRSLVANQDGVEIGQRAHGLKGSSASLGAKAVAAICARLENDGKAGAMENAGELLTELEQEFKITSVLLLEMIESGGRSLSQLAA